MIEENVYRNNKGELGRPCLLCDKIIPIRWTQEPPRICDDCKALWKKIKEQESKREVKKIG